jgi:hypothetical protein
MPLFQLRRVKWEDDHEFSVGEDFEGNGHDYFQTLITELAWKD